MLGLDDSILALSDGSGVVIGLVVALLFGLRHATDPDHLTAVSTLALSDRSHGARRAGLLGAAWGGGHATTLLLLGLPVVLLSASIPAGVTKVAELTVGLLIVALAARLLVRWRNGYFHVHTHAHGAVRHTHVHMHEHAHADEHPAVHDHRHEEALGRTPAVAYGIGLVHGLGGSAGAGILLISAVPGRTAAAVALAVFAAATALSMAVASAAFGGILGRDAVALRLERAVPVLGTISLLFGAWYAMGAI